MSAIDITISGVLFDKVGRTSQPVVLIGEATITGLTIGGGPIIPPGQPGSGLPDHIWGPTDPRPNPPIANVPGAPGYNPPDRPPEPIEPPVEWKAVWHPTEGWMVVGVPQFPHPTPS